MIKELVKIANELDRRGLTAEADQVDRLISIKKTSAIQPFSNKTLSCSKIIKNLNVTEVEDLTYVRPRIINQIICRATEEINQYFNTDFWGRALAYVVNNYIGSSGLAISFECNDLDRMNSDIDYSKECLKSYFEELDAARFDEEQEPYEYDPRGKRDPFSSYDPNANRSSRERVRERAEEDRPWTEVGSAESRAEKALTYLKEKIVEIYEEALDEFHENVVINIVLNEDDPRISEYADTGEDLGGWIGLWSSSRNQIFVKVYGYNDDDSLFDMKSTFIHEIAHSFYTFFNWSHALTGSREHLPRADRASYRNPVVLREEEERRESWPGGPGFRGMAGHLRQLLDQDIINNFDKYLERAKEINYRLAESNFSWLAQTVVDIPLEYWLKDKWESQYELFEETWKAERKYVTNPTEIYARIWVMRVEQGMGLAELCGMNADEIRARFGSGAHDVIQLRMFLNCNNLSMLNRIESQIALLQQQRGESAVV